MDVSAFIHETEWGDLPEPVRHQARRCLLDTLGVAVAGRSTELSHIVRNFAAANFAGRGAYLWLDGREVSPPGAALANGMTIDALDLHDGYNPVKGHAGVAIVPASLATLDLAKTSPVSGRELLATLVVGYEIALRAGEALHATACDYHTSGAWNALGAAAVTARRLGLSRAGTQHALGIAEYHGPRSPMMRCIDFPTMLKDGSGWGAMAGVSAALLASSGFTGAPAETVQGEQVAGCWEDLGQRWRILELYFKPHAVCRWGQPAIEAALALQRAHSFALADVREIRVFTFAEAVRLARRRPRTTEEAQYSLPFPLAAALVFGQLGPAQLSGDALHDERVLALAERVTPVETAEFSALFPTRRYARLEITLADGSLISSDAVEASWDRGDPPGDGALREKFRRLVSAVLQLDRAVRLEGSVWRSRQLPDAAELVALLAPPPEATYPMSDARAPSTARPL